MDIDGILKCLEVQEYCSAVVFILFTEGKNFYAKEKSI